VHREGCSTERREKNSSSAESVGGSRPEIAPKERREEIEQWIEDKREEIIEATFEAQTAEEDMAAELQGEEA